MNSYYLLIIASVAIASFSQILLKIGATKQYSSFIKQYLNPYVIIGYGLTFLSMILTILSYKGLEYKIVPLMESLGYIIVMFLSRLFFQERLTSKKIIGTALILIGIVVYNI